MAKLKTKQGLCEFEYDINSERIDIEFNGVDTWTFKINKTLSSTPLNVVKSDVDTSFTIHEQIPFDATFPTLDEVINFIKQRPNYEYDSSEIQMKFFNKYLSSRTDKRQYFALDSLIRKARDYISDDEGGEWLSTKYKGLSGRKNVKIFEFKKTEVKETNNQRDDNFFA